MSGATLRMRAFRAARAFACRRMVRRARARRMPWRPVGLRWRRAMQVAPRVPGAKAQRAQQIDRTPWRVQMQLRVDVRSEARSIVQTTTKSPLETRNVAPAGVRQPRQSVAQENAVGAIPSKSSSGAGLLVRPVMRTPATMTAKRSAATRPASMASMQLGPRVSETQVATRKARVPTAPRLPAQLSLPHQHQHAPKAAQSVARRPLSAIDAFATRSPELVWRTNESKPAEHAETPHAQAINAPIARPDQEPQVAFNGVQEAHSALRHQPLDPAMIDRVADDVIRRIDRQLRIERERRGL